jgi:hypothetical protein
VFDFASLLKQPIYSHLSSISDIASMSQRIINASDYVRNLPFNMDANVLPDDRVLVRNVVATLLTLHPQSMYHTIEVQRAAGGYNIVATIIEGSDFDVVGQDLLTIESVSPMRVQGCFIERRNNALRLRVRLLSADEPVNVTETMVTHIRKRRRILR